MNLFNLILQALFPNQSFDTDLRYWHIVHLLKKRLQPEDKILEVGSGSRGLTRYLNRPVTGADIRFDPPVSPMLKPVNIRGQKLPFIKNSYDWVVSVDMLEHLPPTRRLKAIREMMRVTKKGVLMCSPAGKPAEQQDRLLARFYRHLYCRPEACLKDHIRYGLPAIGQVTGMIRQSAARLKQTVRITVYPNTNLPFRFRYMQWYWSPSRYRRALFWGMLPFSRLWPLFSRGLCYRRIWCIERTDTI